MNSIKDILDKYNVTYKTHGKNIGKGWVGVAPCPSCLDSRFHFGINTKKPQAKCFICGFYGLPKALSILCSISYKKAKKLINECYDIIEEEEEEEPEEKDETEFVKLFNSFSNLQNIHRKYLESRNFDPELLERKYGLKVSDNIGKYRYRIISPIVMDKKIVSFCGRDWTGKQEIRYLYCEDEKSILPRAELCYNIDSVRKDCVITEGVTKVWRFGNGSVAVLSTNYTKNQILRIVKKKLDRIFVIFDPEENAQRRARELANILSMSCSKVEVLDIGEDLGDVSEDDIRYLKREIRL